MPERTPPSTFPQELQEVLADAIAEYWHHMPEFGEAAMRFFYAYADKCLNDPLREDETSLHDRLATAFMFAFKAGREHAIRGYASPIPKEVPPDEMPQDLEDDIERMRDDGQL